MRSTLDQLIQQLQELKASGVPGDTLIGVVTNDNNGNPKLVQLNIQPRMVALAKDEADKDWETCRKVTRGGVPAVLID